MDLDLDLDRDLDLDLDIDLSWTFILILTLILSLTLGPACRWFSVLIQLCGASLYAYIVGVASGIVASMNKEKMHFQETLHCELDLDPA